MVSSAVSSAVSSDISSPTTSPSPSPSVSRKKGKNWTTAEDEQLCKSWLAIAQDPIIGNEQKSNALWERVHSHFVTALPASSGRNQISLSNRWSQIQKAVNKFCGFFAQIETRNESGKIFEDKVRDAMVLYQQESNSAFTMFSLWTILRNAKKWQDSMIEKNRYHKRKAETPPIVNELGGAGVGDSGEQDTQNGRPPGKKTAKMMAKDERASASIQESSREMAESSKAMVKLMEKKTAALELISQDLIMSKNLTDMDETARRYYEFQKAQILKKTMEQNEQ